MLLAIPLSRQNKMWCRGTKVTIQPGYPGGMSARISGTNEMRNTRTEGTDQIMWRQLSSNSQMPAAASVRDETIINRRRSRGKTVPSKKGSGRTGRSTHMRLGWISLAASTPYNPTSRLIIQPGNALGCLGQARVKEFCHPHHLLRVQMLSRGKFSRHTEAGICSWEFIK